MHGSEEKEAQPPDLQPPVYTWLPFPPEYQPHGLMGGTHAAKRHRGVHSELWVFLFLNVFRVLQRTPEADITHVNTEIIFLSHL